MHLFFSLSLISFGQAHKIYPAENHQNLLQMHIFCLHICSALNIERKKKKRKRKKSAIDKGSLPAHCRSSAPLLMILTTFSGHQLQPVSFRYCLKIKYILVTDRSGVLPFCPNRTSQSKFCFPNRNRTEPNM